MATTDWPQLGACSFHPLIKSREGIVWFWRATLCEGSSLVLWFGTRSNPNQRACAYTNRILMPFATKCTLHNRLSRFSVWNWLKAKSYPPKLVICYSNCIRFKVQLYKNSQVDICGALRHQHRRQICNGVPSALFLQVKYQLPGVLQHGMEIHCLTYPLLPLLRLPRVFILPK